MDVNALVEQREEADEERVISYDGPPRSYNASQLTGVLPSPSETAARLQEAGFAKPPSPYGPLVQRALPGTPSSRPPGSSRAGAGSELAPEDGGITLDDIYKVVTEIRTMEAGNRQMLTALTGTVQNLGARIEEVENILKGEIPVIGNHLVSIGGGIGALKQGVAKVEESIKTRRERAMASTNMPPPPGEAYSLPAIAKSASEGTAATAVPAKTRQPTIVAPPNATGQVDPTPREQGIAPVGTDKATSEETTPAASSSTARTPIRLTFKRSGGY